jgi:hypothetical protein
MASSQDVVPGAARRRHVVAAGAVKARGADHVGRAVQAQRPAVVVSSGDRGGHTEPTPQIRKPVPRHGQRRAQQGEQQSEPGVVEEVQPSILAPADVTEGHGMTGRRGRERRQPERHGVGSGAVQQMDGTQVAGQQAAEGLHDLERAGLPAMAQRAQGEAAEIGHRQGEGEGEGRGEGQQGEGYRLRTACRRRSFRLGRQQDGQGDQEIRHQGHQPLRSLPVRQVAEPDGRHAQRHDERREEHVGTGRPGEPDTGAQDGQQDGPGQAVQPVAYCDAQAERRQQRHDRRCQRRGHQTEIRRRLPHEGIGRQHGGQAEQGGPGAEAAGRRPPRQTEQDQHVHETQGDAQHRVQQAGFGERAQQKRPREHQHGAAQRGELRGRTLDVMRGPVRADMRGRVRADIRGPVRADMRGRVRAGGGDRGDLAGDRLGLDRVRGCRGDLVDNAEMLLQGQHPRLEGGDVLGQLRRRAGFLQLLIFHEPCFVAPIVRRPKMKGIID